MLIPVIAVLMTIIILLVFAKHTHQSISDSKLIIPVLNPIEENTVQEESKGN